MYARVGSIVLIHASIDHGTEALREYAATVALDLVFMEKETHAIKPFRRFGPLISISLRAMMHGFFGRLS